MVAPQPPPQMMPVMMIPPRPPMAHRMVAPMPPQHGYMPNPMGGMGGMGAPPPPRPPIMRPPGMGVPEDTGMSQGGPPQKKSKTEDSLIPEHEFLKRNQVMCSPIN